LTIKDVRYLSAATYGEKGAGPFHWVFQLLGGRGGEKLIVLGGGASAKAKIKGKNWRPIGLFGLSKREKETSREPIWSSGGEKGKGAKLNLRERIGP